MYLSNTKDHKRVEIRKRSHLLASFMIQVSFCLGSLLQQSLHDSFLVSFIKVILHTRLQLSTYKHLYIIGWDLHMRKNSLLFFLRLSDHNSLHLSPFLLLQTSWLHFSLQLSILFSMWTIFPLIYWWTPKLLPLPCHYKYNKVCDTICTNNCGNKDLTFNRY